MWHWLFAAPKNVPARVATDEVLPVFELDKAPAKNIVSHTMRFNDVLDTNRLYEALSRLIELGQWRKLGGRLRETQDGGLEIHIPAQFTAQRPAVGRSGIVVLTPLEEHPVASKMVTCSGRPSIHVGPYDLSPLSYSEGSPTTLDDYLYSDRPQIHLYTMSFTNATIVSVIVPHILDAVGHQALYTAWCHVLAGREDQIAPFLSFKIDPLGEFGLAEKPWALQPLKGLSVIQVIIRFIWDALFGPKVDWKMIYLPSSSIRRLRDEAQCEIPHIDDSGKKTYVSEGDVLISWLTRIICLSERPNGKGTVLLTNNVDLRGRLAKQFPPSGAYVQNALCQVFHVFKVQDFFQSSLRDIAIGCRRQLVEQVAAEQIEAQMYLLRQSRKTKKALWLGAPDSVRVFNNNCTKCNFHEVVDFSPAVIRQVTPDSKRVNALGKMDYHHSIVLNFDKRYPGLRNMFTVYGKDPAGNCFILGALRAREWAKLERELDRM